ncbi:radical SAM protein [Candidatus Woesearchaeota archaeon]|nr:radical SAM protein [Candidatus Woesearchaeota archaeon]
MKTINELINTAQQTFQQHFPPTTCFERAIFYSWDCSIKDCGFCYMSAHEHRKNTPKQPVRTTASILAEVILCKKLGWEIGFLSGGINALTHTELKELLHNIYAVYGQKIWLNIGPVAVDKLKEYSQYIKGVVGSIETINPELHKKVCPSKPTAPYEKMFEYAQQLGLQNAMSFIVGIGETINDFQLLEQFIKKYNITKIHIYGLIPHKRTMFENTKPPTAEYQAEWIARIRCVFPTINIQCGIWEDRTERIELLLKAGANTVSKFQAIKYFGTKKAKDIEEQATKAGREFKGTLTEMPQINTDTEVEPLQLDEKLKQQTKQKLADYINRMNRNTILCEQ